VLAAVAFAATTVGASVDEAWLEVQEVLSAPEGRSLEEHIDELIQSGQEIDVRRMTPHASALVAWSLTHPDSGDGVLEAATRVDPQLPASYFELARRSWRSGAYGDSTVTYLKGWLALFRNEVTRRSILVSIGIWLVLGVGAACVATVMAFTIRTLRRTAHDAMTVGRLVFERANAVVFGLVLLLLPLLAGLGPTWLIVYLFVVGWVYLDRRQRIVAMSCCALLLLVPFLLEAWQRALLRVPPVTDRVAVMLDERQLNPSTLREFVNLKETFDGDTLYHLILGELLRMHSALESAKLEYQTAALQPFGDARPFVILGNMALEDGNVQLAIQHYDEAIETDGRTALAYHNLSSAYDLNRRFQQGDAARARARELAGGRSASLGVRGRDPRIRYPVISSDDVDDFVATLPEEQRLQVGFSLTSWRALRQFLTPLSVVFWSGGAFGIGLLLLRLKWFGPAKECAKCGKIYRLDDEPGESAVYCRQCVSVFLQRDLVPIDQQTAKLAQVRRWDRWSAIVRRLSSVAAPGSYQLVTDRLGFGLFLGVAAWLLLLGVVVWVPRFLAVVEPTVATMPIAVALWMSALVIWLISISASWERR
jgi:hypothetical protein